MKKLNVFLALMFMSAMVFAQTRNLRTADSELKRGRLDRAVTAIQLAIVEPENLENANAWFSQAKIYTAVAATPKPEYSSLEPNAIQLALQAFIKTFNLDKDGRLVILGGGEVQKLINAAYDKGAAFYADQNFSEASNAFRVSVEASALVDIVDTNAMFNTALCAEAAGNKVVAKEFYQKLVDMKADQPAAFTALALILKDEDDLVNTGKYVDLAVELFPENYNTLINAASIHLMIGNSERASVILDAMSVDFADNPVVFFAKGVAFEQINMPEKAEEAYLKAIELRPDYFDAIFNLAAHYVTRGVSIKAEADALPMSEQTKYDELNEIANEIFKKAIPMLEKANEMESDNIPVMSTLKDIYVHLRMMDRANELNEQIERLQQ